MTTRTRKSKSRRKRRSTGAERELRALRDRLADATSQEGSDEAGYAAENERRDGFDTPLLHAFRSDPEFARLLFNSM
jgi:hypothetical protein